MRSPRSDVSGVGTAVLAALAALLGTTQVLLGAAAHAQADPTPATPGPSCVLVGAGDEAAQPQLTCFDSLPAAVQHATGGALRLPPDATTVEEHQLAEAAASQTGPAVATVLGIEYLHAGFTGPSLVLTWPGAVGCSGGGTYGFPSMGRLGWPDRISSAKAYAGCRSVHYEHSGYRGATRVCWCASMGSMNDRTSSVIFRP